MSNELTLKLQDVFRRVLNQPALVLTRELSADDVRGWDSLKHVELIVSVESAFGVRFKTPEVGELNNVGDLIDRLATKVAARR